MSDACRAAVASTPTGATCVRDHFMAANVARRVIEPGHRLGLPYVVLSEAEINRALAQTGWDLPERWRNFHQRYPESGGFIELSAVGFDSARKRAMVYMAYHCDEACAWGTHHLLKKMSSGTWREIELPDIRQCEWVS